MSDLTETVRVLFESSCTCIGCGAPSIDGLCNVCETNLRALETALAECDTHLELVSVKCRDSKNSGAKPQ